jgi:hypothetical protein
MTIRKNSKLGPPELLLLLLILLMIGGSILAVRNKVVVLDNCEYIRSWNGRGYIYIHKDDCPNPIHYNK